MCIMKADYALILAAGRGSRMGEIGKELPKVLWPIFERTILELEVEYARSLGINNIFINTHFFTKELKKEFNSNKTFEGVTLLEERDEIDIGGAIHNMASQVNYQGTLLVLNSDQFLMLSDDVWNAALDKYKSCDHLLFSYDVNTNDKYNALIENEGILEKVALYTELKSNKEIQTYTGMSLINLSKLTKKDGKSKFFESVADFNKVRVGIQNIKQSRYWDFGTLDRYWSSMFEILQKYNSNDEFITFLKSNKSLFKDKVKESSYNSEAKNCINLSNKTKKIENSIILASNHESKENNKKKIIWNDLVYYF